MMLSEKMEEEKKFASTWNTSQGIIMELVRLKSLANQYYTTNRIELAIQNLIAIKQTIIGVLAPQERTDLKTIENEFFLNAIEMKKGQKGFSTSEGYWTAYKEQYDIYDRYNEKLMDTMQSHDLSLGEKTDVSKYKG